MMLDIIIQGMCCCRERVQAFSSRWVQPRCAFRLCQPASRVRLSAFGRAKPVELIQVL